MHLPASSSLLDLLGSWVRPHPGLSPQGHLHDRYGQLVNIYTKLLLTKISFHLKVASSRESWGLARHPTATLRRVGSVLSPPAPGGCSGQTAGKSEGPGAVPNAGGGPSPALDSDWTAHPLRLGVCRQHLGRVVAPQAGGGGLLLWPLPSLRDWKRHWARAEGAEVAWGCPLRSTHSSLQAWR